MSGGKHHWELFHWELYPPRVIRLQAIALYLLRLCCGYRVYKTKTRNSRYDYGVETLTFTIIFLLHSFRSSLLLLLLLLVAGCWLCFLLLLYLLSHDDKTFAVARKQGIKVNFMLSYCC